MTAPASPTSPAAPAVRAGRRRQQPTRRVAALVGVGIGVLGVVAAGLAVERRTMISMGRTTSCAPSGPRSARRSRRSSAASDPIS